MTEDPRSLKDRLSAVAADIVPQKHLDQPGNALVIMSGSNDTSREALLNRDLIIQHLPFTIGGFSHLEPFSSMKPDLIISDHGSDLISPQHLAIEQHGDEVVLSDENSRSGSLVNDTLLGKNVGGQSKIKLREGKNDIILGGASCPFIFQMEVMGTDKVRVNRHYVGWQDHITPVTCLYIRLCHYTKAVLTDASYTVGDRIQGGLDIIATIAKDQETIDRLYCYSAHPDTVSDVIVAHSVNVAICTAKLLLGLSLSRGDITKIGTTALLHDIGLYDIPEDIIYKEEEEIVSRAEYNELKRHPTIGYEKLSSAQDQYKLIPSITLEHHERIDGSGYPNGLKTLSEITELLGIVDFFEAITHCRPMRGPLTPHMGMNMLLESKKGKFSRETLTAFVSEFSFYPVNSVVQLNSGEVGQVVKTNRNWPLRPIVRILLRSDGQPQEAKKEVDLLQNSILFITKDISDHIFTDNFVKL